MSAELREWLVARHERGELQKRCTAAHPNHEWNGQINGEPLFWQAWCTICDEHGYLNEDATEPNPEMTLEHIVAARIAGQAEFASRSAIRRRTRKSRCVCPTCGTEHISKAGAKL